GIVGAKFVYYSILNNKWLTLAIENTKFSRQMKYISQQYHNKYNAYLFFLEILHQSTNLISFPKINNNVEVRNMLALSLAFMEWAMYAIYATIHVCTRWKKNVYGELLVELLPSAAGIFIMLYTGAKAHVIIYEQATEIHIIALTTLMYLESSQDL
ncbi:hypothetical protein ACJX0J_033901, partial [Zea mays]